MNSKDTQLTNPETYNTNNLVFSKAVKGSTKVTEGDGAIPIKFSRVMISTRNPDGTIGELVLPTTELFSFGVSINTAMDGSGKVNGHSLSLSLWNRDNPSFAEKAFSSKLEEIVEKCKDYLLLETTKDDIEKYDLERTELKTLGNIIYWKKEKGKIVAGATPSLYPKLIESKKSGKILTTFSDYDGNEIDPLTLIGKYMYTRAAIKVESIFIGKNISIQIKVYEAEVRLIESGIKKLLTRPKAEAGMSSAPTITNATRTEEPSANASEPDVEAEESDGEKIVDEDEAPVQKAPTPEPVPVRKIARKPAVKK